VHSNTVAHIHGHSNSDIRRL